MSLRVFAAAILSTGLLSGAAQAQSFTEVGASAGVNGTGDATGMAWGDYDNDGDLDIYAANSGISPNRLYQNNGGTFTEVGAAAGVNYSGPAIGVTWGDYDNDGDLDLFVAIYGAANLLYRNNSNGTFTEVGAAAGVNDTGNANAGAWVDYDRDGHLDLYVLNDNVPNRMFHNNGNGTFSEVGASAGVNNTGNSVHVALGDYDNDGDPDLYVSRTNGNILYRNNNNGTFTDVSASLGVNESVGSPAGIAWQDYDNDGDLDLYAVRNGLAAGAAARLYRNNGNDTFTEVGASAGVNISSNASHGPAWGDYDNDGDADLYLSMHRSPNMFFKNNGNGTFTEVASAEGLNNSGGARGISWGDYDNDGDLDLYVANDNTNNRLFRNNGNSNRWLVVKLVGNPSNKNGIGAQVTTVAGGVRQRRDVDGGSGYWSEPSLPVEFGFGNTTTVDSLIVRWPSGTVQVQTGVATNQTLTVNETAPELQIRGKIALALKDGSASWQIYTVNPDGTNLTLVPLQASADNMEPAWSPDGTRIAYMSRESGEWDIWVMNADGTSRKNVSNNTTYEEASPSWSPDGRKILYIRRTGQADNNYELCSMDTSGSGQTELASNPSNPDYSPAWSPDGRRIVFQARRNNQYELDTLTVDVATMSVNPSYGLLSSSNLWDPVWSPDGSKISYTDKNIPAVRVMNTDGSAKTSLQSSGNSLQSTWSADGKWLAFENNSVIVVEKLNGTSFTSIAGGGQKTCSGTSWGEALRLIGSTSVGGSASRTVTVDNKGTATLNVGNITSSDGQFTVSPTTFSVNAGSSQSVTITFAPTSVGTKYTTLTITSNDPDTPTAKLIVNGVSKNSAPTIMDILDQTVNEDTATNALSFTVSDVETATGNLTVSGSSSNTTLVPNSNSNIVFGGSGSSRTVSVVPAPNQSGSTTITVTVSDGTLSTSDTFTLTVNPINDPPTFSDIADQSVAFNIPTAALSFIVGDVETAAGSLTLAASSSNTTLVPVANVVFGGSGANRTVTVTPASGQSGSATITVTVSDGSLTASDSFVLTVAANTQPVLSVSLTSLPVGSTTVGVPISSTFTMGNTGNATLSVTGITVTGTDASQFAVSPSTFTVNTGATAQTVTVTFTPTTRGAKSASLSIAHNASGSLSSVTLSGTGVDVTAPATPAGLSATAGKSQANLSWTANSEADLSHYVIYRSAANNFTPVASDSVGRTNKPGTTFTNTGLSNGTFYYRIAAVDSAGNKSAFSAQSTPVSIRSDLVISPVSLAFGEANVGASKSLILAIKNAGNTDVTVSGLSDNSDQFAFTPSSLPVLDGGDSTTVTVTFTPTSPGTKSGMLTISNNAGGSPTTASVQLSGVGKDVVPPATPSTPAATAGGGQVSLSWTANGEADLSHYVVYRSTTNNFTPTAADSLLRVNRPATAATVPIQDPGTYYFKLAAVDSAGNKSAFSAQAGPATFAIPEGARVYGSGGNKLVAINALTNTVAGTVSLPAGARYNDVGTLSLGADLHTAYAVTGESASGVVTFDVTTNTFGTWYPISGNRRLTQVGIAPDQRTLFVVDQDGLVHVVEVPSGNIVKQISIPSRSFDGVISKDGSKLYLPHRDAGTISVINTTSRSIAKTISVPSGPNNIAISPDGTRAYVTHESARVVSCLDLSNDTVLKTVAVQNAPIPIVVSSDGRTVYVGNRDSNSISVIDVASWAVVKTVSNALPGGNVHTLGFANSQLYATGSTVSAVAVYDARVPSALSLLTTVAVPVPIGGTELLAVGVNTPPWITINIDSLVVNPGVSSSALPFTVGDAETPAANLTVSGTSSNTTLVPNGNIVFAGSGANRTVTVTPVANQTGSATITVTVTDGGGLTASDSFTLTVPDIIPQGARVYGSGGNKLVIINAVTNAVAGTVSLPAEARYSDVGTLTLAPDLRTAYGVTGESASGVVTFDVTDNTFGQWYPISGNRRLTKVGITPDQRTLFVVDQDGLVHVLALASGRVVRQIRVPSRSFDGAMSKDGTKLYLPHRDAGSISVISTASRSIIKTISVPAGPNNIALSSDGTRAYVTHESARVVSCLDLGNDTVIRTVAVQNAPIPLVVSSDGRTVYVGNRDSNSISVIDVASWTVIKTVLSAVPGGNVHTLGFANNQLYATGSTVSAVVVYDARVPSALSLVMTVVVPTPIGGTEMLVVGESPIKVPTITSIVDPPAVSPGVPIGPLSFMVNDAETPVGSLTVSGSSSNTVLVPNGNIVFGGSGASRTVTVTPAANQVGSVTITVTVSDGSSDSSESFTITVRGLLGDVNGDGQVDSGDAILVLRHSAGLTTLTDSQKDLGDVNGDRSTDSGDAILILRFSAGIITRFPRGGAAKPVLHPVGAGLRLGEVRTVGEGFAVPLILETGVNGADLSLHYDGTVYQLVGVERPEGVLLVSNSERAGELRLAVARLDAGEPVALLVHLEGPVQALALELLGKVFGAEGGILLPVESRLERPLSWSLSGYPNPFNASTTLRYDVAKAGEVRLTIYDISGAIVRHLVSAWQAAGQYSLVWDGRDEEGRSVASGLYLSALEIGSLRRVHKLMLLK